MDGDYQDRFSMESQGPSKVFIFIGVLMIIAGVIVPVSVVLNKVSTFIEIAESRDPEGFGTDIAEGVHLEVPDTIEINIVETGTYTIYHEHRGRRKSGETFNNPMLGEFSLRIINLDTKQEIRIRKMTYSETYNIGGRSGYGIHKFDIKTPGKYSISAVTDEELAPADRPLLFISKSIVGQIFEEIFSIFIGAGIGVVLIGVGIVIIVVTSLKRARLKREAEQQRIPPLPLR